MSDETNLQDLISWLNLYSVSNGAEFTLSSGQKSSTYIDVKKTAQHHRGCKLLAQLLTENIARNFAPISAVAGVVLGGCHLASIVAMAYPLDLDVVFVRTAAKDHGTQQLIEKPLMQGRRPRRVVLLEDVITTGASALKAAKLLEAAEMDVVGILAVVDRRKDQKASLSNYRCEALVRWDEASKWLI